MESRKDVLGSNIVRKARIEDRIISILHNGESGPILFYAILPKRRQQVLANTHDHVLRTTKQDWLDDYDDDVVSSRSCMIDDDEYDLLL